MVYPTTKYNFNYERNLLYNILDYYSHKQITCYLTITQNKVSKECIYINKS